ncbi:sugar kinase [Alteromonadaceae bacterium BrNp21-10]|nr:sugar kinase [Alteromonadaceae bacterium BrNp21-10]
MSDVKSNPQLAVIGECMVEISGRPFSTMQQSFGGDSMNTAIYLKKLSGDKLDVNYVSAMGIDALSSAMIEKWQSYGINTDWVLRDQQKHAGLYMIQNDASGERTFQYWRNDSAARYMVQHPQFETMMAALSGCQAIYLSGISLAILPQQDCDTLLDRISELAESGVKVIFDSNYRPVLWQSTDRCQHVYERIYAMSDLALVTYDDEQALWADESIEQCRQRLHQCGVKQLVVKDGANGCQFSVDSNVAFYPAQRVDNLVDTTAAGDSFNAGFLSHWLFNGWIEQCAQSGNALAAQVIQQRGAIVEIDVDALTN